MKNSKPILISMGDVNGVGPEICAHLLRYSSLDLPGQVYPLIIGSAPILKRAIQSLQLNYSVQEISSLSEWDPSSPQVFNPLGWEPDCTPGQVQIDAGEASILWVKYSVEAIQAGLARALVTAPLSKAAVEPKVPGFQGHTEYIGEMCGDPEPVLALVHGDWVVSHVSTHVSLREACDRVQTPRVAKATELLADLLLQLKPGQAQVKIGMAGLNPHAGEGGLFGSEEQEVLIPFVQSYQRERVELKGPLPGDVVFPQMKAGSFDGVVAMYHDQGHVVTKTIAFELGETRQLRGVNITLGLDIVRTSVDHGTGFDIAWQGQANEASLIDALELAERVSPA